MRTPYREDKLIKSPPLSRIELKDLRRAKRERIEEIKKKRVSREDDVK